MFLPVGQKLRLLPICMTSILLSSFIQTGAPSLYTGHALTFCVTLLHMYPTAIMFTAYAEKLARYVLILQLELVKCAELAKCVLIRRNHESEFMTTHLRYFDFALFRS